MVPWLNWIEQPPPKGQVIGSNPIGTAKDKPFFCKVIYWACEWRFIKYILPCSWYEKITNDVVFDNIDEFDFSCTYC